MEMSASEPLACWNGEFLPQSQVRLGINDAGFVWGATVTDLCRTFRHQLFRLDAHLIRFRNSCDLARIPQSFSDDQLAFVAQELVRNNAKLIAPEHDLALVMFATPGEIGYYVGKPGGPGDGSPTLCMHTFPLPFARYASLIQEGAWLQIPRTRHISRQSIPPAIKQRSRLHWWLAQQEIHRIDVAATPLLLDPEGYLTETPAANLLLFVEGRMCSPSQNRVLGGISLMVVEELCNEIGVPFDSMDLRPEHSGHATEAMLCSTPYCLAPVSRINDKEIPWPGPIFQQLIAAWNRKVGVDIWQQIVSGATGA